MLSRFNEGIFMSNNQIIEKKVKIWEKELSNHLNKTFEETDFQFYNYSENYEIEPCKNPVLFLLTVEGELWQGLNYGDSRVIDTFDQFINKQDYYYEIKESCLLSFHLRNYSESEPYYRYFFSKNGWSDFMFGI